MKDLESPFLDARLFELEQVDDAKPATETLLLETPFQTVTLQKSGAILAKNRAFAATEGQLVASADEISFEQSIAGDLEPNTAGWEADAEEAELWDELETELETDSLEAETWEAEASAAPCPCHPQRRQEFDSAESEEAERVAAFESETDSSEYEARDDESEEPDTRAQGEGPRDEMVFEMELEHVIGFERDNATPPRVSPTLGFEFDLNYGFEREVVDAKSLSPPAGGWEWPQEGLRITDHQATDLNDVIKDGIKVTLDSVRMEIATAPVKIDDRAEFKTITDAVIGFGQELVAAQKTLESTLSVADFGGHPTTFEHPRTVVNKPDRNPNGTLKFPGDAKHAGYQKQALPLVVHRVRSTYPTKTALWSSPQATLTLPLAELGRLIWEIHGTKGGAPGVALTGRAGDRLGLRDDLAWTALTRAVADRKRRIGTLLSDGSNVRTADFTRSVTSLLTIAVMYLLTGVRAAKADFDRDKAAEAFAKGSLPLNVKTPLWAIHKHALTDRERLVFKELYGDPAKRVNLYRLAKPGATIDAGKLELFPEYTRWDPARFLGSAPTWEGLVEAIVDEKRVMVTEDNDVPKKGHQKGEEILLASLSSKIDWDRTKPLIAVEMRRIGFAPVAFDKWLSLMQRIFALAHKVNP